MSFRTLVVSSRSKLDLKLGYLVIRRDNGTNRVFLDDVDTLIIENPACSMTGCLLAELLEKKINVLFCDAKHLPLAQLCPLSGSCDGPRKIKEQLDWDIDFCDMVWTAIVARKIANQADLLAELKKADEADLLREYLAEMQIGDITNREGHAAKVYFNAAFGNEFARTSDNCFNSALDYGYALILSAVAREIVACGYLTQIGLGHHNTFNNFNLASDLMEPYRAIVDRAVLKNKFDKFESNEKYQMVRILEQKVVIDGKSQTVLNSIRIYVNSVFHALRENNLCEIKHYKL